MIEMNLGVVRPWLSAISSSSAVFDKPVHMYRGTTMAGIIRDEARHDPSRGFVGGYEMETLSLGLPLWIVGEDMPREENRITLRKDKKDEHGMPIADVHFDDHPNDTAMRDHAYSQGQALYAAVGATRTFPTPPYPSTHNLGTNRMSREGG